MQQHGQLPVSVLAGWRCSSVAAASRGRPRPRPAWPSAALQS